MLGCICGTYYFFQLVSRIVMSCCHELQPDSGGNNAGSWTAVGVVNLRIWRVDGAVDCRRVGSWDIWWYSCVTSVIVCMFLQSTPHNSSYQF
jgi:hypothetical protein